MSFMPIWVIPNGPAAAWAARLYRVPLLITLHGSDIFVACRHRLLGLAAGWVFRQTQAIIACSPELVQGAQARWCKACRPPFAAVGRRHHSVCPASGQPN